MLQVTKGDVNDSVIKYETKHAFDSNLPYPFDAATFFKEHAWGGEVKSIEGARCRKILMYIALLDT